MSYLADRVATIRSEARTIASGRTMRDRARIIRTLSHAHLRLGRGRHLTGWLPQAKDDPPREIALRDGRRLLTRRTDAIVLNEHIGFDVYGAAEVARPPVRTVLDLGANVGFATLALHQRYRGARFVCVEPAAETRALLERNLALNGIDSEVFGVAIVGTPGRYSVDHSHYPAANAIAVSEEGEVEGVTLAQLLDRASVDEVDLMKIDIEGGEREVFEHAAEWAPRVRALIGELHGDLTAATVESQLAGHGFRQVPLPPGTRTEGLVAFVRD